LLTASVPTAAVPSPEIFLPLTLTVFNPAGAKIKSPAAAEIVFDEIVKLATERSFKWPSAEIPGALVILLPNEVAVNTSTTSILNVLSTARFILSLDAQY
jgi:hypothetical protein